MPARLPRRILRPRIAAALAALLSSSAALAQAPAPLPGDPAACAAPSGPIAAATCADPAARLADRRRALAYEALRHQLHPAQRPGLEADARAFHAFITEQCQPAGTPDPACIARAHATKRDDLRRWLQPPAAEEADRDPEAAEALNARLGLPTASPEARREAIAALQRGAALPPTGFLDARTAALPPPPSPANAAPPNTVWLPRFPPALNARYAVTRCNAPTASWTGNTLRIGNLPEPGETYEIFADAERFYLLTPAGPPRILEGLPDNSLRLSGAIPPALSRMGVKPGQLLRRCG
ncbi:hypothetical protein SAMN02745194_04320 [Roseomonas rosea]|uniref:Lysozyme inhibitor LprI N-terminal domain-containing protein n=1 Tax=Muricoccus roseus TaxID=198092 RepID=A0A1M6Q7F6_9PROT|nr:hypothetical protein [Roseomonas rosea]SHK16234.1 hypothetical protein SAMN02745194_04320 [Roseomonas rosea]